MLSMVPLFISKLLDLCTETNRIFSSLALKLYNVVKARSGLASVYKIRTIQMFKIQLTHVPSSRYLSLCFSSSDAVQIDISLIVILLSVRDELANASGFFF